MNTFYKILVSAHSGTRWLLLIFLLAAIFQAFSKRGKFGEIKELRSALLTLILMHIQVLIGIILFFMSPKVQFSAATMKAPALRFFTMEHSLLMIIAAVLITMGYSKAKKSTKPFNVISVFYLIALILILVGIPWPFRTALGAGWF